MPKRTLTSSWTKVCGSTLSWSYSCIYLCGLDEEDAFESDFESTDEEAAQEDLDTAAEKQVREDERGLHKVYMIIYITMLDSKLTIYR